MLGCFHFVILALTECSLNSFWIAIYRMRCDIEIPLQSINVAKSTTLLKSMSLRTKVTHSTIGRWRRVCDGISIEMGLYQKCPQAICIWLHSMQFGYINGGTKWKKKKTATHTHEDMYQQQPEWNAHMLQLFSVGVFRTLLYMCLSRFISHALFFN